MEINSGLEIDVHSKLDNYADTGDHRYYFILTVLQFTILIYPNFITFYYSYLFKLHYSLLFSKVCRDFFS